MKVLTILIYLSAFLLPACAHTPNTFDSMKAEIKNLRKENKWLKRRLELIGRVWDQ